MFACQSKMPEVQYMLAAQARGNLSLICWSHRAGRQLVLADMFKARLVAPEKAELASVLERADGLLKILVIDESPVRRALLIEGLAEAGFSNVIALDDSTGLVQQIYRADPDVILIDLENPSRDVLEQMFQVSRVVRRPIAMFVDQSDRSAIEAAIEAGVSAYIVDGLRKERLRPILDMTISRFNAFDKLRRELDDARDALKDRKSIEKAKGLLMKSRGLDEAAAYALLRRTAMSQNRKISEVADNLISAFDLLKDGD